MGIGVLFYSGHPVIVEGTKSIVERNGRGQYDLKPCEDLKDLSVVLTLRENYQVAILHLESCEIDFGAIAEIASRAIKTILWVGDLTPECLLQLISCGVSGILRTTCWPDEFIQCLATVAGGGRSLGLNIGDILSTHRSVHVTRREGQLIALLSREMSNKAIGGILGISEGTTKVYVSRLLQKSGAADRFELASMARANGFRWDGSAGQEVYPKNCLFVPISKKGMMQKLTIPLPVKFSA